MIKHLVLLIISYSLLAVGAGQVLAQAVAPDATRLSVGARILGMGKAFTGLADDVGSIYTNPAGLGNLSDWQLSSMSGNYMEDFNYLNLCGAYPTNWGVLGLGFTNSSISGGYSTRIKAGSDPLDPVYEIDPTQPSINYYNNVLVLSYGNKLNNMKLPFKLPFETLFGANLKLMFSGMSGDGITSGGASGKELDAGILIKPSPYLSLGSTLQNLLPYSMGGKLEYASGHSESYPAVWINGLALKILGEKNSIKTYGGQDLKLLLDFDYYPTRPLFPVVCHTGLEWIPVKMVSLRAGIDQDAVGDGSGGKMSAVSNLTFGVGFEYNGFKFDYAYHQFNGVAGMTDNFFSLSYQPFLPAPKKPIEIKPQIVPPTITPTITKAEAEAKVKVKAKPAKKQKPPTKKKKAKKTGGR